MDETFQKPKIIQLYNNYKGGVDTLNQLCHARSTARKTKLWSLRIFFCMLDQCGVSAIILFLSANPQWKEDSRHSKPALLKEFSLHHIRPRTKERITIPTFPRNSKQLTKSYAKLKLDNSPFLVLLVLGRDVSFFQGKKKTVLDCAASVKPVCPEHRSMMRSGCVDTLSE